ncbi:hypothetical protein VNO77_21409 [Canavalia gladiata]|uniref:Uncharacterized protein n=1 Tax=Canavalia gladiata TaxID=3824 RepID=A0AAN9QM30_CANGL
MYRPQKRRGRERERERESFASSNLVNSFILANFAKKSKTFLLQNPISQPIKQSQFSPPSFLSISLLLFPPKQLSLSGDQESQSRLIHITDHLNRRGRVLVCGGTRTSASLESSLLYLFMKV